MSSFKQTFFPRAAVNAFADMMENGPGAVVDHKSVRNHKGTEALMHSFKGRMDNMISLSALTQDEIRSFVDESFAEIDKRKQGRVRLIKAKQAIAKADKKEAIEEMRYA